MDTAPLTANESARDGSYIVYVDTGGTFSDAAIVAANGSFTSGKAPTTPDDLEECFFACIKDGARKLGLSLEDLLTQTVVLGFGTTAGTNALITGVGGPRLGMVTTRGFEDTLNIMRMEGKVAGYPVQQSLHLAGTKKPPELVERRYIVGVEERIDSRGRVAIPLDEGQVRHAVQHLLEQNVDGIGVCFLWSFLNATHERRALEIVAELAPDIPAVCSADVAPVMREYPRFTSTIVDLLIGPPVRKLLSKVHERLESARYTRRLLVMQASGGLSAAKIVRPIKTLHSGPVGGLTGVEFLRQHYDEENALGSDMGGTSFDISLARRGRLEFERTPIVARYHLANPMLGIEAIGAGGGTIAGVDPLTKHLRLGPASAGAVPGPVCYGRGGTEPTVTDANVVLNRINPEFFLDGKMALDRERALEAIERGVGKPLGIDVYEAALGIVEGIEGIMRSGIRAFLNRKGLNPREVMVVSFGGAGPTHVVGYTSGLGFKKIVVPPQASTFSAFGASTADVQHRYESSGFLVMTSVPYEVTMQRFNPSSLDELPPGLIDRYNHIFEGLEAQAYAEMAEEGFEHEQVRLRYVLDVRYGGQLRETSFETAVRRLQTLDDVRTLLADFEDEYIRLYTQNTLYPRGGVEIITLTVEAAAGTGHVPQLAGRENARERVAAIGAREVYTSDGWREARIYAMSDLKPGQELEGLAIVEGNDTTVFVPAAHNIVVDTYGNLILAAEVGTNSRELAEGVTSDSTGR